MKLVAVDPGNEKSAYVVMEGKSILDFGHVENADLVNRLRRNMPDAKLLAIEMVASYGMPVGETTFETVLWIGRFIQVWDGDHVKVYRKRRGECESVGMHLCKSTRAKDANIRQAIIDRYEPSGGGKVPQVGTKKQPGPLFGVSTHIWAAIGVGITAMETRFDERVTTM